MRGSLWMKAQPCLLVGSPMCFMSLCSPGKLRNNPPALRVSIKFGAEFKFIASPHFSFQFTVCLNLWLFFCYGCSHLSLPCPERECHRKGRLSCAFQSIHSAVWLFEALNKPLQNITSTLCFCKTLLVSKDTKS